ncbi:MAG: recombinase family protein [Saprospiraceae bacterium]|nr:recombinase family protein [Candidatus Defluviibacterium haderslevense]
MKQYIAYLRVSTKGQEKSGLGLEAQRAIIKHFVDLEQSTIVHEVLEAESGKDIDNRPKLNNAIQECETMGYTLIVAKLDRLSRNVEHIFRIHNRLGNLFRSCDLPTTDSLTLSIFAGLAQREREIISIRTKQALAAKKARGEKLGTIKNLNRIGRIAGNRSIKEKAVIKNQMAKSFVNKCDGMTLAAIATELNNNGFKTSQGKKFHKTSVKRLRETI